MERVVVDADGRVAFSGLDRQLEVADTAGKTLGYFVPPATYWAMVHARLDQEPTAEELDAARRETGGLDIAGVLDHIAEVERRWKEGRG